jgi:3-oxoadipate enol-lactonase
MSPSRLASRSDGPEGAPHVTFSHSLASDMRMWEPQAAALRDSYRVLRFDTRGHGSSAVPSAPYSLGDLVGDVVALLDDSGVDQTHFVGLSMGGMIAQGLALEHPDRVASITVANSMAVIPEGAESMWDERIATAREHGMNALADPTIERWFTAGMRACEESVVTRVRDQILATSVEGYVGCSEAIKRLDYASRLGELDVPTLLIAGDQDAATPAAAMRVMHAAVSNSEYVELKAAHLSNLERPAEFTAALVQFLSS